jgi:hypothetical protein
MTSPSCQHDPLAAADLSQSGGEALPAALVIREYVLDVSFIAARVRLVKLIAGGSLAPASIDAYACGLPKLARRGPADALSAVPLITVRIPEPANTASVIILPLRWHAIGPGGQQVRVLNADLSLIAARAGRTVLRLQGEFRLPFAISRCELDGDGLPQRAATASMNFLLAHIRKSLTSP